MRERTQLHGGRIVSKKIRISCVHC